MRRILITGANGQLGLSLRDALSEYSPSEWAVSFTDLETFDLSNPSMMADFLKNNLPFDFCVNTAAFTNVESAEKNPADAYKINADGAGNLASLCKAHQIKLIHISTDYVFDGSKQSPYLPGDPVCPINIYGHSKLNGETLVAKHLEHFFIIRTSWLYSKRHGHNFYKTILKKLQSHEPLKVINDQIGCPTSAEDLAKTILDLMASGTASYGIHHYCGGKAMSWFDFAVSIAIENGLEPSLISPVGSSGYQTLARRPKYSVLENTL